ncbi:MAG: ribonuclease R [Marinagarivorans sp.]|nr:ribonuclease R [Marinagarivorans sp.]
MPDTPSIKDPAAAREAQIYANPIASRELILQVIADAKGPLSKNALIEILKIEGEDQLEGLRRRLIAMERDGQILRNRRGAYGAVEEMDLIRGRVSGHRDGFGFLIAGAGEDIYLSNREMRKVFDGDEVLVRISGVDAKGRQEGNIVEVLAHNTHSIVGRYTQQGKSSARIRPDNPRIVADIFIAKENTLIAKDGQFVNVHITRQPDRFGAAEGIISEILGDHMAPGMEIDVAIRSHDIPHIWPQAVIDQAAGLSAEVTEQDKLNRIDLRKLPLVTIDGEDARDFDDAVYCERKRSGGWRLYVAIADVSHYVKPNSALDNEALIRGNSVYFPDHVIPMLPEALSNGLCSLKPEVDRLCMVCEMTISDAGKVSGYHFYEAVMHSHARLTYTKVGTMLAEKEQEHSALRQQYSHVVKHIDELHNLYHALRATRTERGAIDFETVETRIEFDENRKIARIVPVHRNDAHKLIEECMLAANVCAARFLEHHDVPALYRVHEGPKEQKLNNLIEFLTAQGLGLRAAKDGKVGPEHYQEVMKSIIGRPDAGIIQTIMLRSMNQAVYQPDNKGHFGLAYTAYTHFTSPIRRYPDLLVHRAIRSIVRSTVESARVKRHPDAITIAPEQNHPYDLAKILTIGEQSSLTERRADEATRDVMSWLKCEFLSDRIGDVFEGLITAVTGFGFFVEIKDLYVEGLVHISNLPQDFYHFEPAHHRLLGERTRKVFALGDSVVVRVTKVNLDERKVDFELEAKQPHRRKNSALTTETSNAAPHSKKAVSDKTSSKPPSKDKTAKASADKTKGPKKGTAKKTSTASTPSTTTKHAEKVKKSTKSKVAKKK